MEANSLPPCLGHSFISKTFAERKLVVIVEMKIRSKVVQSYELGFRTAAHSVQ